MTKTAGVALAAAFFVLAAAASLGVGPVAISPARALEVLGAVARLGRAGLPPDMARDAAILIDVRGPRTALGALAGAALALGGAVMQGVFRNPLADPGLVGVSGGAALAAVAWIVLGEGLSATLPPALNALALPVAAFFGGLAATALLARIATRDGRTEIAVTLLAGVALGAFVAAVTGLLVFLARDDQLRTFLFWTLGSLGGATWVKAALATPFVLALVVAIPALARGLDAVALGERAAFHSGVDVERLKRLALLGVAASSAAAVAGAGAIGFIGLAAPHLVRLAIGPSHHALLPAAALAGAGLLLASDVAARIVAQPAEMPIGVVTAAFGAPFFLWLLMRRRGKLFG
ncbi:FecCD family ABC transporter permease [Chenggangzhangella methanolivorans]|uniref:Iron ABC transporter permease n=1 Tax=Chenggangzhangella methanolivorans TaxID=1437009 RepID=A0A9E6R8B6_9HYPH|nr:iron ABC transporter permease [Chenggangzhangella methanolivorans]QZN98673.1 iron ABC transporter permease [Chenggangzhangella methanolivorans]